MTRGVGRIALIACMPIVNVKTVRLWPAQRDWKAHRPFIYVDVGKLRLTLPSRFAVEENAVSLDRIDFGATSEDRERVGVAVRLDSMGKDREPGRQDIEETLEVAGQRVDLLRDRASGGWSVLIVKDRVAYHMTAQGMLAESFKSIVKSALFWTD
jgi:hypothetical protein